MAATMPTALPAAMLVPYRSSRRKINEVIFRRDKLVTSRKQQQHTHREKHVFLVLVDGSEVGDSFSVLDHTDRLT